MSKLIVPQWPQPKGVAACSSTRIGGVSLPPYDSLNLGAHCGDNPDHVEENRKRLFAAGNLPSKPVWLEQVHGKDVLKLTGEPYASKRADASYSNTPGTVCAVMTADCLPVLFDNPENILAWLGPAIGPRAFEVGGEVREAFMAVDAKASAAFIQHGDKYLADIYQLARQRLANVGVEQIFGGDRCTYTENETFFSYRRDKTTGRMASFIWLI